MSIDLELKSAPPIPVLYWRALTARKSQQLDEDFSTLGTAKLEGVVIDRTRLDNYCKVCGFSSTDILPVTFPFVLAMPLQLSLLVSEAFPFPVLGIVHVSNDITQYRPIGAGETLNFYCELSGPRPANRGREFDLHTRVTVGKELVWESVTTMLLRQKSAGKKRRPEKNTPQKAFEAEACKEWLIPADTGRRYARVSGDRNPIHLYALTAKLFGFPRAIVHGMWSKARCLAELEQRLYGESWNGRFKVRVDFSRPLMMPAKARFESAGNEFRVTSGGGRRVHLTGTLETL